MKRLGSMLAVAVCCLAVGIAVADEPKPAAKVYDVPKENLVIEGQLNKDDPRLANAPVDEAKDAPHQVFRVQLRKGQSYVVYLLSENFDAFLMLQDSSGKTLAFDDDSGGGTNSRIVFTAPDDGDFRVLAGARDRKPGDFELRIRPGQLTEQELLAGEANKLTAEGKNLQLQGQLVAAHRHLLKALQIREKLYPPLKFPKGHIELAESLNSLGSVLQAMGQSEQALTQYESALAITRRLYPSSEFPNGNADLAACMNNLGFVLQAMGQPERAVPLYVEVVKMLRRVYSIEEYPEGHLHLAASLNNLGAALDSMGQAESALRPLEEALVMRKRLFPSTRFPDGHPSLALSLNNMASVLRSMGQLEKALPFYEAALAINRRLYPESRFPDGHPQLATSLSNLAFAFQGMGQAKQAQPYSEAVLAMRRRLYPVSKFPDGHPNLAISLNNLGSVLKAIGEPEKAISLHEAALAMNQRLYPTTGFPDGHPSLALTISNLAVAKVEIGQLELALSHHSAALEMRRRLYKAAHYPEGHPDTGLSLGHVGNALLALDRPKQALPHFRDALAMQQRLLKRELATASEEAAIDKLEAEPQTRESYLSITRTTKSPAELTLAQLWPSRAIVTRLLEQRQANARAAGTELGGQLDRLRGLRRRTDQLLQDTKMKPADRDKLLVSVANERDQLERELVNKIPALRHWQELDKLGPADLVRALPSEAVFLDVISYTHIEFVNKKQKRTPRYVAFVIAKDGIRRVELGEAKPIDDSIQAWRQATETGGDLRGAPKLAAAVTGTSTSPLQILQDMWAALAKSLPAGTTTLYIAPDGDLSRMPWAALPIAKDRVLLEDFAIAQVPHGTFLLDQLRTMTPALKPSDSLLAVGDIEYGPGIWPMLPGTKAEIESIVRFATGQRESIRGTTATKAQLAKVLPESRVAHFATHGRFDADEFTKERIRAANAKESRLMGDDTRKIAAKNPLGYVGLVLSNGEIMSGLSIVDLQLQKTHLVTLSACETGLGAYTGGEGVQGLQRAFHVAGCRNVVASLWRIPDVPTLVLMEEFYSRLWHKEHPLPPIDALREAQLAVMKNPQKVLKRREQIRAELVKRGLSEADLKTRGFGKELAPLPNGGAIVEGQRSPVQWWSGFVLSGVGR